MDQTPIFGIYNPTSQYIHRPGVYGLLVNQNCQVAVIQKPDGAFFLPGGGLEAHETSVQGLQREIQEELGCAVLTYQYLARAHEYSHSPNDETNYFFLNEFYFIEVDLERVQPAEEDHMVCWIEPCVAREKMMHQSHAWALDLLNAQSPKSK